jgi:DNA replication protein DnaC
MEVLAVERVLKKLRDPREQTTDRTGEQDVALDDSTAVPAGNYPGGCDVCRGVGFVFDEAAWERNGFRGGLVLCPACGQARRQERLERMCGLSDGMHAWTLAGFWSEPGREAALEAAWRAVEQPRGFLTFWGPCGTGKTYLLAAIVNECRARGMSAVYTTVADLLDTLRESFDPDAEEGFPATWRCFLDAQVLALDEIEKFSATAWAEEKFFQLVDHRYRWWRHRLTVFATNRPVREGSRLIESSRYSWYFESRLLDERFAVVELVGRDMRRRGNA